jgi:hypothetical protein
VDQLTASYLSGFFRNRKTESRSQDVEDVDAKLGALSSRLHRSGREERCERGTFMEMKAQEQSTRVTLMNLPNVLHSKLRRV